MPVDSLNPPVKALERGLGILQFIASNVSEDGVPLSDIADFMNLKQNTTHNLVKTLEMCGFVLKQKVGHYRIGWKMESLGRASIFDLSSEGPAMRVLYGAGEKIGYDIAFTSLINGKRVVLNRVIGSQLIRVDSMIADSEQKNIWEVVTGRVLAAFCDKDELREIIAENGMPDKYWPNIFTDMQLQERLTKIRSQGYAENVDGDVASIAFAVLIGKGKLAASVGVSLPAFAYNNDVKKHIAEVLGQCCNGLSEIASKAVIFNFRDN